MVKEVTALFDRGLGLCHSQATLYCKRELYIQAHDSWGLLQLREVKKSFKK